MIEELLGGLGALGYLMMAVWTFVHEMRDMVEDFAKENAKPHNLIPLRFTVRDTFTVMRQSLAWPYYWLVEFVLVMTKGANQAIEKKELKP